MVTYKDKNIFCGKLSAGNPYRKEYAESIDRFIQKRYSECRANRDKFMKDIAVKQEEYRKRYVDMLGQPVSEYPEDIPAAKTELVGKDDFCEIYHLQIETLPGFMFYGLFMIPHGVKKAPLVIAQHGGGSTPEICSELLGESNYSFFTKRALERGMAVFVPQLLLWKFGIDTGEKSTEIDVPIDRGRANIKLNHLGLSITGLEVFCIRRSIDYITSLDYIDETRIGMMGLSYGGYFSLHTAAADTRIRSIYAAGFFNNREKVVFDDWIYRNSANTFCDAEVAALCAPRRLWLDVGKTDPVFDYTHSVSEGERAKAYYEKFGASEKFRFNIWDGGHRFDQSEKGFDFFFDGI